MNTTLAAKLDAMDTKIKTRAPNATVIVLGYPRLFSGTCFGAFGISSAEVTAANNLADAIDNVTKTEATKYGFTYKSAIAQFTSHGVCASSAWLNGLNLGSTGEQLPPDRDRTEQRLRPARTIGHGLARSVRTAFLPTRRTHP